MGHGDFIHNSCNSHCIKFGCGKRQTMSDLSDLSEKKKLTEKLLIIKV